MKSGDPNLIREETEAKESGNEKRGWKIKIIEGRRKISLLKSQIFNIFGRRRVLRLTLPDLQKTKSEGEKGLRGETQIEQKNKIGKPIDT